MCKKENSFGAVAMVTVLRGNDGIVGCFNVLTERKNCTRFHLQLSVNFNTLLNMNAINFLFCDSGVTFLGGGGASALTGQVTC